MPWIFRRRRGALAAAAEPADATTEIEEMQATLTRLSIDIVFLRQYVEMWGNLDAQPAEQMEDIHSRLDAGMSEITAQLDRLRMLQVAHEGTSVTPNDLEIAIHSSLRRVYDMLRDKGEFRASAPHEITFSASGSYILPLDPDYQYQLLFAHPLQPELTATLLVIPTTYAEQHLLAETPDGVRRIAFNIHAYKSPPGLIDAVESLHRNLWPVMWLVTRERRDDGKVESRYWRCVRTRHMKDLPKFPDYLCLYFEYQPEGRSIPANLS